MTIHPYLRLALLSSTLISATLHAQDAPAPDPGDRNAVHGGGGGDIVVTGRYVGDLDVIGGRSVVSGETLTRDLRPQIGDTLSRQPGVSASSFSPGASRPVLRGFQGERVQVLTDGIGTIDVSSTSADHAVSIDPLTAERIEVLRGPAVLLFGSQAIGGAVNVIDRRIPRAVPDKGYHLDATAAYGSATNERSGGASFDVAIGGGFVAHGDGSYRKTDDLEVGGFVLAPNLRADQIARAQTREAAGDLEGAAESRALAALRGRVPNSDTRTYTLGGGLALIRDGGHLGASVSYLDSDYGVPARPGDGEENVSIGLRQWRADLRAEITPASDWIDAIRLRAGYADYRHTEFEGEETGTVFKSDGVEGRLEIAQAKRGGWRGAVGVQGSAINFDAIGEEAFVPPSRTTRLGIFTLQELTFGDVGVELGGRYEHVRVSTPSLLTGEDERVAVRRTFDNVSGALGLSYTFGNGLKIGANLSRAVRAPSPDELFANGAHVATQAFEIGDAALRGEKSWGAELFARGTLGPVKLELSVYHSWFTDFVYQADTGLVIDGLPAFQIRQADARHYGAEANLSAKLFTIGETSIVADGVADVVRAKLTGGRGPVPRIPPLRLLGGLEAQSERWTGRIELEWTDDQTRTAAFETPTRGFTLANASLTWRPGGKGSETAFILSANNIFDIDARRHASFTKDFVPLPGRDLRLSVRFSL
jgi:iron complex outermembrane receptor protein